MTHSKRVCRVCSRVVSQCRCLDPNKTVIEVVCEDCGGGVPEGGIDVASQASIPVDAPSAAVVPSDHQEVDEALADLRQAFDEALDDAARWLGVRLSSLADELYPIADVHQRKGLRRVRRKALAAAEETVRMKGLVRRARRGSRDR